MAGTRVFKGSGKGRQDIQRSTADTDNVVTLAAPTDVLLSNTLSVIHVGMSATPDAGTDIIVTTGAAEIYRMPIVDAGITYVPFFDSWLVGAVGATLVITVEAAGTGVTSDIWYTEGR